jgi:SAM-dependent methyltransferase
MPANAYREDLAFIHDAGFGHIAENAAPALLQALRRAGLRRGRVVDLGCGSGILSQAVAAAGYDVLGIDLSPAMIELARRRVPQGEFRVGSILAAELPPCIAVAAIGEIVNYLFEPANTKAALSGLFERIHAALAPGGILLLDVAGPGRIPGKGPQRAYREGDGWAVLFEARVERDVLTRTITSFRRTGELYRRDHEVHRLRLLPPSMIAAMLRRCGLRVRQLRRYGRLALPRGMTGLFARRR